MPLLLCKVKEFATVMERCSQLSILLNNKIQESMTSSRLAQSLNFSKTDISAKSRSIEIKMDKEELSRNLIFMEFTRPNAIKENL